MDCEHQWNPKAGPDGIYIAVAFQEMAEGMGIPHGTTVEARDCTICHHSYARQADPPGPWVDLGLYARGFKAKAMGPRR